MVRDLLAKCASDKSAGSASGSTGGETNPVLEQALLKALGKAPAQVLLFASHCDTLCLVVVEVVVNMELEMKAHKLDGMFPPSVWPPTAAVREVATRAKALCKAMGREDVFIYCDLKKCGLSYVDGP